MGLEPLPLYTVGGRAPAANLPVLSAGSGAAAVLAAAEAADRGGRAGPEDEMEGLSEERLSPTTVAEGGSAMPACNPCFTRE